MRTFRAALPFLVVTTLLIALAQTAVLGWMLWRRDWVNAAIYGGMALVGFTVSRALWGVRRLLEPPAA